MDDQLRQLIDEFIKLELNMAELYIVFSETFPEDAEFWNGLQLEEKRHALLLQNARDILYEFPVEILPSALEEILKTNSELTSLVKGYRCVPPFRESAFKVAFSLEQSVGEIHYQRAMESLPESEALKIFQELNNDYKNHAARIRDYMKKLGLTDQENM